MGIDYAKLRAGVDHGNIPSLLMCLFQMTGDAKWLEEPFAPKRGKGLDDNDSAGLPDAPQQLIRDAAYEAIVAWLNGQDFALSRPSNAQLAHMLSVAMVEDVPNEYGDVIAATMRLEGEASVPRPRRPLSAIVIGAGVSGICAAIKLAEMG
ncbi:MAG: monooxygenase, partial [Sphingosinicella sp.]|nr:monooxygenase [Sphingosinicella sp.]